MKQSLSHFPGLVMTPFLLYLSFASKFEYSTLLSIYHNQDMAEVIYIVHNPVFGFLLNSMVSFQTLYFANVKKVNHITAKSMCFNC